MIRHFGTNKSWCDYILVQRTSMAGMEGAGAGFDEPITRNGANLQVHLTYAQNNSCCVLGTVIPTVINANDTEYRGPDCYIKTQNGNITKIAGFVITDNNHLSRNL